MEEDRMIVFEGKITETDCLYTLKKKQKLSAIIKFVVIFLLISLPIVVLSLIISFYILIGLVLTMVIAFADIKMDNSFRNIPNRVVIDDYGMEAVSKSYKLFINLNSVVSVIDMGTWYTFKFNLKMNNFFVCQKDLLIEGSLEEFEKLFEGKIERKVKS